MRRAAPRGTGLRHTVYLTMSDESPQTDGRRAIERLKSFAGLVKVYANYWDRRTRSFVGGGDLRSRINTSTPWVRQQVLAAGCLRGVTVTTPDGHVLPKRDPFDLFVGSEGGDVAARMVVDMVERTIGVLMAPKDDLMPPSPPGDDRTVFVVHGRNDTVRDGMFGLLRALGLKPLEWEQAVALTGQASPYMGDVLAAGMRAARAAVVLLTGDDEARLRDEFHGDNEPAYEIALTPQPRPNVLLEAGMVLGLYEARTILVEVGHLRGLSDLNGRNVIRLDNTPEKRKKVAQRLKVAGCAVDDSGDDWLRTGDFSLPAKLSGPVSGPKAAHPTGGPGKNAPLSDKERDLLIRSLYGGERFVQVRLRDGSKAIHVGGQLLFDDSVETILDYVEAAHALRERGFCVAAVSGRTGTSYRLTAEGIKHANELRRSGVRAEGDFPEISLESLARELP